jgi:hypothetical protein
MTATRWRARVSKTSRKSVRRTGIEEKGERAGARLEHLEAFCGGKTQHPADEREIRSIGSARGERGFLCPIAFVPGVLRFHVDIVALLEPEQLGRSKSTA